MHLPLCPAFMVPLCCEAQAEMQTEAVKVEVLQSGEAPCTAGGTYMYLHLPSKNRVSIRFQATGWSVRNVHMLEISFWYWIAIPFGLWLVSPLALFTIKRNFPFAHHGGCEDDCRFLLASILPDEGLDWTSMILCNSATLWFLTFGMPHFPLAALRGCGSREKFDLRGHEFYFQNFWSSIDWWWENERWLVAGNYTVKQNLLHLYIVRCCNSLLIVFHGGCEDDCRFLLASILPDEGLDWPSMILCNSATLWFFTFWMPHFPLAALGGCGSHKKFDLRGHEFYFLIFLVIYRLVVREWEVVGSGKLYSQTESSSSILFFVAIPCWLFSMEDAKTIVDSYWHQYCQMKDWIGQAWFCATLQLFDFSLFGCHIFLLLHSEDAEVAKNSICEDMSSIF